MMEKLLVDLFQLNPNKIPIQIEKPCSKHKGRLLAKERQYGRTGHCVHCLCIKSFSLLCDLPSLPCPLSSFSTLSTSFPSSFFTRPLPSLQPDLLPPLFVFHLLLPVSYLLYPLSDTFFLLVIPLLLSLISYLLL
uniref:Uncharacterized protein n=1 Tax=Cacopsylla melanoneura TaxID=428564 RepID=A0A8D8T9D0_9HEMI